MPRMLLCMPQQDLAEAMGEFFEAEDYIVEREVSGLRALEQLRLKQFDIVILEIALHGLDGLSVVRDYRSTGGNIPIMLLTGSVCSEQLQMAYDAGADAYIAKPFKLNDLAAQLRALLRRPALRHKPVLNLGNLMLDTVEGTVSKDDSVIVLCPMEFKLLLFLMKHQNQVFDAHTLFERVWRKGSANMSDTVRTHIKRLRSKIDSTGSPSFITTVRGLGYKTEPRL